MRVWLGLLCWVAMAMVGGRATAAPAPWGTVVLDGGTEPERLAARDLCRYLGQVTHRAPETLTEAGWRRAPRPAVVLALRGRSTLVRGIPPDLGAEGYQLANRTVGGVRVVVVAADAPMGVVNGIYGLLRELRYGLFLGSESVPASLPSSLPSLPITRRPAFSVRGVLPWYNFFNSPTAWDPVDHHTFADQLIRSGANFVGFHTYDMEPFAAYPDKGDMKWGERLLDTRTPTWGTSVTPTSEFAYGTNRLYAHDAFGAATTRLTVPRAEAIRREQAVMRDALGYAHRRGLKTCIGFEINGDPTRAEDRDVFLRRVEHVLDQYPCIDFLWIWEPETQGAQGFATGYNQHILRDSMKAGSALDLYGAARRPLFRRVVEQSKGERPFYQDNEEGRAARAREGARLEQFAMLARRAIGHRTRGPRVAVSGWGGDDRLLSAEYYEGLDKLLPKDVVFTSLDFIAPRPRVDRVYDILPADRQRWPIPWLENDGDQWQPQPWVHIYEGTVRAALAGGSQGLLGIHWRTRDVEESFAYLMDAAWQPGLTVRRFYRQLAGRCYPAAIADEMARIHEELDGLGYRWVGGGGQPECGAFSWGSSDDGKAARVAGLRARAAALLPRAGVGRARVKWLMDVMDWTLAYRRVEAAAVRAAELLRQGKAGEALACLDDADMAGALRTYASRLTTRGEYGVLATVNAKALASWKVLRESACAALGRAGEPLPGASTPYPPGVVVPRLTGTVAAGRDLEVEPIVFGGVPSWLLYRPVGTARWASVPLTVQRGWVCRAVVPAARLRAPGVEIAVSIGSASSAPSWGPVGVTVMPAATGPMAPLAPGPVAGEILMGVRCTSGRSAPFEIEWTEVPYVDYYRVLCDGKPVCETAVTCYFDAARLDAAPRTYRVEAVRAGKVIGSASCQAQAAGAPPPAPIGLVARARTNVVQVAWPAPASLFVAGYRVYRVSDTGRRRLADLPAERSGRQTYLAEPVVGRNLFEVVAVGAGGSESAATQVAVDWPRGKEAARLDLPLVSGPGAAAVFGKVLFDGAGAHLGDGYLEVADGPAMSLEDGCALSFEFTADSVEDMPVLMSHGSWQVDGWFVQILGGRLIVRTSDGDAEGPVVVPGRTYRVEWRFDGISHRLSVDGQVVAAEAPLSPRDCNRTLRIGQYESVQPQFAFRGTLRNLRIEQDPK